MHSHQTQYHKFRMNKILKTLAMIGILCIGSQIFAQDFSFDSSSDGSDGALNLTEAGTIVFNPADFDPPLDPDGDGVYHFTSINIASGVTVRMNSQFMGSKPVVWLASGDVTIEGILDLKGNKGHSNTASVVGPAISGAGGFVGGRGARRPFAAHAGNGPGGGKNPVNSNRSGGGGGYVTNGGNGGNSGSGAGGSKYGNGFLLPLWGGSGGGGGGDAGGGHGGGGGGGGGAILIASSTKITLNGSVTVKGGDGGGAPSTVRGGGGGSGGSIRLMAPQFLGSGALNAQGGAGSNTGGNGSRGRIRIEAFQRFYTGTSSPPSLYSTPGIIFVPNDLLPVKIVSIDGVPVPTNPKGDFTPADLVIDKTGPATIGVEARGVPTGTVVQLTMWSENGNTVTASTDPLTGTLELSTATADIVIPHGFSRFFVEATWTP